MRVGVKSHQAEATGSFTVTLVRKRAPLTKGVCTLYHYCCVLNINVNINLYVLNINIEMLNQLSTGEVLNKCLLQEFIDENTNYRIIF